MSEVIRVISVIRGKKFGKLATKHTKYTKVARHSFIRIADKNDLRATPP
jgi:hypothetical protein